MKFYHAISEYYDALFPVNAGEMAFVSGLLRGGRKILDIGCGTGNKTVHFKTTDAEIVAVDADETMIARARKRNARPGITYEVMDMRFLGSAFPPATFDAALCLGNTLVHLSSPLLIGAMLRDAARVLRRPGLFVIQILNYDRILARDVRELPALETDAFRFSRFYQRQGETMLFVTELLRKESGEVIKNTVPLYPLRKAELEGFFAAAGFGRVEYYGSYAGDALDEDSFVLIAVGFA